MYLQDLPQLPYMPVSESPYASELLYKCASDPSSGADVARPRLSPAQLAGVHVAGQGAQGPNPRETMFTYSSEPTAMASSMVHPVGARLSESQFHDVAWVSCFISILSACLHSNTLHQPDLFNPVLMQPMS